MSDPIAPCVWLDGRGAEAAAFYIAAFSDARLLGGSPPMTTLSVGGMRLSLLDGGPLFKPNPSISFFYRCGSEGEIDALWKALSEGGKPMMDLGAYPFAEKYGWITDRFGLNWQLMVGELPQKAYPSLMFTGDNCGRAEEALGLYASIFKDGKAGTLSRYGANAAPDAEGSLNYAELYAGGTWLSMMDSARPYDFSFDEGVSLYVTCEDQAEIDYYWQRLSEGGKEGNCGWLEDRYGVRWQIVPRVLGELLADPARAPRVVEAFMKMGKFEVEALLQA